MKKVETTWYCDICGQPIEKDKVRSITLPRRVQYYAKTGSNVKLVRWDSIAYKSSDVCEKCARYIADILPIIPDEVDEGYAD